jgi:hypothetical protein
MLGFVDLKIVYISIVKVWNYSNINEIYTYVHIPTENIAQTCIRLSKELTLQKSVFFYGSPWVEWEKIKTEVVDKDSDKLKELMTSTSPFHFV